MTHRLALLAIVTMSFSCATVQDSPQRVRAIEEASNRLWAAHERADASAMAELVTTDAILMVPGMPDVRGRDGIRTAAEQMFKGMRISNFVVKAREIRVVGDEAYELAWYSETILPATGAPQPVEGRYLIVWKRGNYGAWQVHRNLFNLASGTHQ